MARSRQFRSGATLVSTGLVALLVGGVLGSTPAAAATATFTSNAPVAVRDQTFGASSSNFVSIPAAPNSQGPASPYPSEIVVAGEPGTITDVNVSVFGLWHTAPQDIQMLLVGPHGQKVSLMSSSGGITDVEKINLTFDDEAATAMTGASLVGGGTYRPACCVTTMPSPAPSGTTSSTLSAFDDTDPNGTWQLWISDKAAVDTGYIENGWSLTFQRSPRTSPYPTNLTVSGTSGTITDVDVSLAGLTHARSGDLDVLLVGPGGQQATLLSDAGSTAALTGVSPTFDDEALSTAPEFFALVSTTYLPTNYGVGADGFGSAAPVSTGATALSAFDGTDPTGTWQLFVVDDDDAGDFTGSMSGWSLKLTLTDPPPTPSPTPSTDTAPPTGTVVINGGAARVRSTALALTVTADGTGSAVTGMRFSTDGTTWSAYEPFAGTKALTLPSRTNGTRTVWAQFRDAAGNASTPATDTVVLDTVRPRVLRVGPLAGAVGAPTDVAVKATLSESVRARTVTRRTAFLQRVGSTTKVAASVRYRAARRVIVIDPREALRPGTTYRVTITTGITDLAGNALDQMARSGLQPKRWRFTTD